MHKSTVSHHTKLAMVASGIHNANLHTARHSAASEMINAGVDLHTAGAVLSHKSAASTKRCAHLATQKLADAVRKIGKKFQPTPTAKAT